MPVVNKVLVVGGGIAGMCAAIELRKRGLAVDLVEIDAEWRVYGAGLTISGPTLRALRTVGVLDAVMAQGAVWEGLDFCDASGARVMQMALPACVGAEDLPPTGAIMRPVLARILAHATRVSGTRVRLGTTFSAIAQDTAGVDVAFSDDTHGRYDLVVAADGLHSRLREAMFPDAPTPCFTGQGSWRAVVPRTVERARMCVGAQTKVGMNPVSESEMYLYCLDTRTTNEHIPTAQWPSMLVRLLAEFGGDVAVIRRGFDHGHLDASRIVYRPLEGLLVPAPWHRGRVVLIGDTAHATTPHLAMGAGLAVEDAVVLAEELSREAAASLDDALSRFAERRFERARLVVQSSLRLGEIEQSGGSRDEHSQLMRSALGAVSAPI